MLSVSCWDSKKTSVALPSTGSRGMVSPKCGDPFTSPLQVEAWFNIAEKAIDACLVDSSSMPTIQRFRMDLGKSINPNPFGESLILGANSRLLPNQDFLITEMDAEKPFAFKPFRMRTDYRFNEGYRGNSTVRGWRDYDSIYHAVFACMRGDGGYPKGNAYRTVESGLLLRPAIPTTEIFRESSTYGPKANFKIALRELPEHGRFRIRVRAAKYADGLLLTGRGFKPAKRKKTVPQANTSSNIPSTKRIRFCQSAIPVFIRLMFTQNHMQEKSAIHPTEADCPKA